ncbi:MAG: phosphoribosylglycinamide formyltransferase [Verrucomicrobia bacterium]|nr:phosphoribosylglycinamide formyltransferase [Verrucomicrobiota bacterium]
MTNLAIFASGVGSNADCIISYFKENANPVEVALILTDKENAGIYTVAAKRDVPIRCFKVDGRLDWKLAMSKLKQFEVDWVVLAGFLRKVPAYLIQRYPKRIINLHPALLPKYGGKGMYGDHVHRAIIENKEVESGISIHFVSEEYDAGELIFQKKFRIEENEDTSTLGRRIRILEHEYYPKVIDQTINKERDENKV